MDREPKGKHEPGRVKGIEKKDIVEERDMTCEEKTTDTRKTEEGAAASIVKLNELMMQTMKFKADGNRLYFMVIP